MQWLAARGSASDRGEKPGGLWFALKPASWQGNQAVSWSSEHSRTGYRVLGAARRVPSRAGASGGGGAGGKCGAVCEPSAPQLGMRSPEAAGLAWMHVEGPGARHSAAAKWVLAGWESLILSTAIPAISAPLGSCGSAACYHGRTQEG